MRNLHLDGVRYNTPWLINIFAEFGINVKPKRDERAIRRFLMGQLMVPVKQPKRSLVHRTIELPDTFDCASSVAGFFDGAKKAFESVLSKKGIAIETITSVAHCDGNCGESSTIEVVYMDNETDQELALRQSFCDVFNSMLENADAIYKRVDEELSN